MLAIRCDQVVKTFAKKQGWFKPSVVNTVVDRISFEVPEGEVFGVLGPNGSGKSTLIRIISTLLVPDAGRCEVFGRDVARDPHGIRPLLGRVSVEAAFFKKMSAMENLSYSLKLYGVQDVRRQAVAVMNRLGFEEKKLLVPMEELSRGQQQKVAIARALLARPRLLLLDEPTTGLDPVSKREVQGLVEELRDQGATILLTTHDMEEADALCDRAAIIHDGRFLALDRPVALKATYGRATLEGVFFALTGKDMEVQHVG